MGRTDSERDWFGGWIIFAWGYTYFSRFILIYLDQSFCDLIFSARMTTNPIPSLECRVSHANLSPNYYTAPGVLLINPKVSPSLNMAVINIIIPIVKERITDFNFKLNADHPRHSHTFCLLFE